MLLSAGDEGHLNFKSEKISSTSVIEVCVVLLITFNAEATFLTPIKSVLTFAMFEIAYFLSGLASFSVGFC
jgi:hypothetical protein